MLFRAGVASLHLAIGLAQQPGATEPATAPTSASEPVILAEIGEVKVTSQDLQNFISTFPANLQAQFQGEMRKNLARQMVLARLFSRAATEQGLDREPSARQRIEFATQQILTNEYLQKLASQIVVPDEEAQKYYDDHKAQYVQYKVRHILVKTEEEARSVKEQLSQGAEFEALAREKSQDENTKNRGGEIGWISKGQIPVPEFENAVLTLEPLGITDPVKSPFGYHVARLDEKKQKEFGEAKSEIANQLSQEKRNERFEAEQKKLEEQFKVVWHLEALSPAP